MIWAMVNNNCVEQIRESDEYPWDAHRFQAAIDIEPLSPRPQLGWVYERGELFPNIPDVSPRQIRQAMVLMGMDPENVLALIDTIPDVTLRRLAHYEWEYSVSVQRRNKMVNELGAGMGFTPQILDQLWLLAGSIP